MVFPLTEANFEIQFSWVVVTYTGLTGEVVFLWWVAPYDVVCFHSRTVFLFGIGIACSVMISMIQQHFMILFLWRLIMVKLLLK